MQPATPDTVLGNFAGVEYEHNGVRSQFSQRDGQFFVTTDGPDGELAEFPVLYTFGVYPLQQYLARLPNGRIQTVPLSWDSRGADEGGQRWFHVYGDELIDHRDPLHWTRLSQNWETQCADCHSTNLVKQYDIDTDSFETTFSELNVACEACHGPGSRHRDWAQAPDDSADRGLLVALNERAGISWVLDPETGNSRRSEPRQTDTEITTCAPCHARRSLIGRNEYTGELLDSYQPALIAPPLYHGDGQVLDEVYVYGSFLQSRMHAEGVTCSDCHEPHSLELRAPGPIVCLQCHAAETFAQTDHHLHPADSAGADCIECHMRPSTFMQVDVRHDHSFRIPRPHLAQQFGSPLSCLNCHSDQDAAWAVSVFDAAGKTPPEEPVHWSVMLAAAGALPLEARNLLLGVAVDTKAPPLIRGSAMSQLDLSNDSLAATVIGERLQSSDPLIRYGAARALQTAAPAARAQFGPAVLDDPVKAIRLTAALTLAPLGAEVIPADKQARFREVLDEYVATQRLNAERAESHTNIGNLQRYLGRADLAEAAYRDALRVNELFVPAYVNLADLYRVEGREMEADQLFRAALELLPEQPALRHALGLSLVRQGRIEDALPELRFAADAPDATPRFALAYALALDAQAGSADATDYLRASLDRFGDDPSLVAALANIYQRNGDLDAARELAERLRR